MILSYNFWRFGFKLFQFQPKVLWFDDCREIARWIDQMKGEVSKERRNRPVHPSCLHLLLRLRRSFMPIQQWFWQAGRLQFDDWNPLLPLERLPWWQYSTIAYYLQFHFPCWTSRWRCFVANSNSVSQNIEVWFVQIVGFQPYVLFKPFQNMFIKTNIFNIDTKSCASKSSNQDTKKWCLWFAAGLSLGSSNLAGLVALNATVPAAQRATFVGVATCSRDTKKGGDFGAWFWATDLRMSRKLAC